MQRRTTRWVGLALFMLGLIWATYRLLERRTELAAGRQSDPLLLPLLSLALVILTLGFAGVLIRNLVKLIMDRKRGILGSRLRTKLVFFFLVLVLLPAIVLFTGSAKVIRDTVEAILWIRTPMEELARQSHELVDHWSDYLQHRCLADAEAVAADLQAQPFMRPSAPASATLGPWLERWRERQGLHLVQVHSRGGEVLALALPQPQLAGQLRDILDPLLRTAGQSGAGTSGIIRLGGGLVAYGVAPVAGHRPTAVAACIALPTDMAENWERIDAASLEYKQFRLQRRELVRFYLTLIGLIFLATLFVATWIGFHVSRRITVPIQELATAAREISAGNLDVRVRSQVGDELGTLVEAFNDMAAELQENRKVITHSTGELRRSNRALDERRRYIETLLAHLSTGVISLDLHGRVTTVNPAVEEILGVRLAPGEDARSEFRRHGLGTLADVLEQVQHSSLEGVRHHLKLPDGKGKLSVAVQASPLAGGSPEEMGTLVMVEDLSDLLRAQKALAWQEVARRIAHEIKNPLTPIQLAAQRLRKKFNERAPDLDQVLLEATASIEREVGGLKRLVNEFYSFARMPEVMLRPVQFSKVVDSVLVLYKGLAHVHWEVDLDPGADWISVDAEQIRRALINLIDNAVAAMNGTGQIRITSRASPTENLLRIEVADSGPGIPANDRDKMFLPYFSTKERGTGLGLAIVHKVIRDHQGTIRVEENPPHGARFVIEIPSSSA